MAAPNAVVRPMIMTAAVQLSGMLPVGSSRTSARAPTFVEAPARAAAAPEGPCPYMTGRMPDAGNVPIFSPIERSSSVVISPAVGAPSTVLWSAVSASASASVAMRMRAARRSASLMAVSVR